MSDAAILPAGGYWLPILIPGDVDATAIRKDYETAMKGLQAFVRMGFRLLDVKSRLPHGRFIAWCNEHLKGMSRSHLHRAKFVAEGLCDLAGIKCPTRDTFDELPPALAEIVTGATGIRGLMTGIQAFRNDPTEAAAKEWCEDLWSQDPELRDEFEPLVLAGERTYVQAKIAMLGVSQRGAERGRADYPTLFLRNARSFSEGWRHWDEVPAENREAVLAELQTAFRAAPDEVKRSMLIALK